MYNGKCTVFRPPDSHGCGLQHLEGDPVLPTSPLLHPHVNHSDVQAAQWGRSNTIGSSCTTCCTWMMWRGGAEQHCPLSLFDFHRLPLLWREEIQVWEKRDENELWHKFQTQDPLRIYHHIFTFEYLLQLISIKHSQKFKSCIKCIQVHLLHWHELKWNHSQIERPTPLVICPSCPWSFCALDMHESTAAGRFYVSMVCMLLHDRSLNVGVHIRATYIRTGPSPFGWRPCRTCWRPGRSNPLRVWFSVGCWWPGCLPLNCRGCPLHSDQCASC